MTQSELIVLGALPGPTANGISDAVATDRCWREGLSVTDSWPIRKDLMARGLIEAIERGGDNGTRLYFRLTAAGVVARGEKVTA